MLVERHLLKGAGLGESSRYYGVGRLVSGEKGWCILKDLGGGGIGSKKEKYSRVSALHD